MVQKTALATSFLPEFCSTRIVFVVILLAELLAILLTLAQPPITMDGLYDLAVYSMFIQWVALSCVASLCVSRHILNGLGDFWAATGSYTLTLVVALVVSELAWRLLAFFPAGVTISSHGHAQYLFRCMSISAIVSALTLRYFYVQHQWRRRMELEAEARFQALQSRIRPHFLFNCMNTIASLTRRTPELAEESIEDLADLFRASLQDIHHISTLADEISLCKRYLRIEKHRLGDRLALDWDIDVLPGTMSIPGLSLQPLLENAIYHGIETLPDGGCIEIQAKLSGKQYEITIENPLPAPGAENQHKGNKLAQDNIRQRLVAFFGTDASLRVDAGKDTYRVTLTLPLENENTDR